MQLVAAPAQIPATRAAFVEVLVAAQVVAEDLADLTTTTNSTTNEEEA